MYSIEGTTIKLTRGDTFRATVTILQSDGTAYTPASGDVITFGVKRNHTDSSNLITKTIPNNTLLLELAPSDTSNLDFGSYVYNIKLTYANNDVDTFISGMLMLGWEVS